MHGSVPAVLLTCCRADAFGPQVAVITLGEAGCSARSRQGDVGRCSAAKCEHI